MTLSSRFSSLKFLAILLSKSPESSEAHCWQEVPCWNPRVQVSRSLFEAFATHALTECILKTRLILAIDWNRSSSKLATARSLRVFTSNTKIRCPTAIWRSFASAIRYTGIIVSVQERLHSRRLLLVALLRSESIAFPLLHKVNSGLRVSSCVSKYQPCSDLSRCGCNREREISPQNAGLLLVKSSMQSKLVSRLWVSFYLGAIATIKLTSLS